MEISSQQKFVKTHPVKFKNNLARKKIREMPKARALSYE